MRKLVTIKKYVVGIAMIMLLGGLCMSFGQKFDPAMLPFQAKEKLIYKIYYNLNFVWIPAGEVVFEVKDEGDLYHLEVTGRTYPSYEWFYKVRDKYHSYIDKKTLLPKLYIRDVHQGGYRHYEKVVFDYQNKVMRSYLGKTMATTTLKEIPFTETNLYDLVSVMYFLRTIDMNEFRNSKRIKFNMILDNEKYNLAIQFLEDVQKLSVKDSGNFRAVSCKAEVVAGKVFEEDAEMKIFIGDDENKYPVMIETPIAVGSIKAVLKGVEWPKFRQHSKL